MRLILGFLIVMILVQDVCYAGTDLDTVLKALCGSVSDQIVMDSTTEESIISQIKARFGADDTDMAFIFSIRGAMFGKNGEDIFETKEFLMFIVSLYFDAKSEWKKPVDLEFYDFFKTYASDRLGRTNISISRAFQLDQAKKRFKLPH